MALYESFTSHQKAMLSEVYSKVLMSTGHILSIGLRVVLPHQQEK